MKKYLFFFLCVILFNNCCKKPGSLPIYKYIYKTKGDYLNLISCLVNNDGNHIIFIYDHSNIDRIKLVQNYVFDQTGFIFKNNNVAFLSLTGNEYDNKFNNDTAFKYKYPSDTLDKLIKDKDPFIELYQLRDNEKIDTAKFNSIICNGDLSKYYKRLK